MTNVNQPETNVIPLDDTREKLEADIYKAADALDMLYCGEKFIDTRKIIRLLDRQAAITERDMLEKMKHVCAPDVADLDRLQAKVDQLTAELETKEQLERDSAYMRLPVDADGVPIHCGDRIVCNDGRVREVWLIGTQDIMTSDHVCHDWAKCRHVKPRTIEDVLHDFWQKWEELPIDIEWSERLKCLRGLEVETAAEIRELLGDAE